MQPQMANGGDLTPQEMNEITNMMNQGGMARKGYYGGGFSNTGGGTSFYNPDPAQTATAIATPTRYTGSFSNVNRPVGTGAVVQDSPVTLYGPNGQVVTVQLPSQQEAYNNYLTQGYSTTPPGTTSITQPQTRSSSDSDDAKAEKKRLADMVAEQERASRVAIGDMTKEQALEAYQGAQMAKYVTSGMVALNPAIAIIGRLFAGNESKKIEKRLKELGVTELPKVDYKKGGIIGNILGGNSLLDVLDNAIVGLQEGKIGTGTSKYKPQFNPSNQKEYGNNLQQSTGSIWGSEQEAYDHAVRTGNYHVANHFDAVNRLRGKQNNFYESTKGMSKTAAYAEGRKLGLSVHDMDQAFKYGGSLGRAISSGVVEKEGFFGTYEFKAGKDKDNVNDAGLADAQQIIVQQQISGNNDGPSGAEIAAARAKADKIDKEQKEKIISSGDTYSTDTSTAVQQMRDRGTFNVGGRATGGLVSRPKKKKK
jgi:hypothetical protein